MLVSCNSELLINDTELPIFGGELPRFSSELQKLVVSCEINASELPTFDVELLTFDSELLDRYYHRSLLSIVHHMSTKLDYHHSYTICQQNYSSIMHNLSTDCTVLWW